MKKSVFTFTLLGILSSCAFLNLGVFRSGVQIPPGEEFILGEGTKGAFDLELENTCYCDIPVETRNAEGERTSSFGLAQRGTVKLTVRAGDYAVLQNPYKNTVAVNATMKEQVYGMRYQALSDSVQVE